jgi:hypothetical protein
VHNRNKFISAFGIDLPVAHSFLFVPDQWRVTMYNVVDASQAVMIDVAKGLYYKVRLYGTIAIFQNLPQILRFYDVDYSFSIVSWKRIFLFFCRAFSTLYILSFNFFFHNFYQKKEGFFLVFFVAIFLYYTRNTTDNEIQNYSLPC